MAHDPAGPGSTRSASVDIDVSIPHPARIWNYWMGGKDNYAADRAAGDAVAAVYPDIVTMAKLSRQFLIRVVRHLAGEVGIRQFLDIGTGPPTMQNTHEVAQGIAPDSRIVYVDNDPLVMGVLGYEPDLGEVRSIVSRVLDATPAGSHLVLWDGTDTGAEVVEGGEAGGGGRGAVHPAQPGAAGLLLCRAGAGRAGHGVDQPVAAGLRPVPEPADRCVRSRRPQTLQPASAGPLPEP